MEHTPLILSLLKIVDERFSDDEKMLYRSFDIHMNSKCTAGEPLFYATIRAGVPETCAGLIYSGGGNTINEAIADLSRRVIDDRDLFRTLRAKLEG